MWSGATRLTELRAWLTSQRTKLSRNHDVPKACLYMRHHLEAFTCFRRDGWVRLTNNAVERALRRVLLGRKACRSAA